MATIEIPKMPQVFTQGLITKDGAEELLKWQQAFKSLGKGCDALLEEEAGGSVKFKDGNLMQIYFPASPIKVDDSPYGEAMLDINNRAWALLTECSSDYKEWFIELEKAGSPITNNAIEGTWEEIYRAIKNYLAFSEKMIPPFPDDLC